MERKAYGVARDQHHDRRCPGYVANHEVFGEANEATCHEL